MADVLSQPRISHLIDNLQGELPAHNLGPSLAALIYLRWADFYEAEQEAIAAFDGTEYLSVLPAWLHWRSWFDLKPRELQGIFADRLPQALERLINARHDSLATNLYRIASTVKDLGRLSPLPLEMLIRWLADQPFETPSDRREMLDVLDVILGKVLGRHYGEFSTPAAVARLIVEIAAPTDRDRVYDPCFGSAGLLTAASEYVLRKEQGHFGSRFTPKLAIFGVECSPSAYVIGLTRLALAGIDDPQLELGSSLERMPSDNPQRDGFDVVLANPPWGTRVDPVGLDHFPVRTTDTAGLFVQHALSQLRPDGRAVVAVPQDFLFRGGRREQRVRQMLLEQHTVEAVVAMPKTTLSPYSSMAASIIVLRRKGPTERIRMCNAAPYFQKGRGHQPATIRADLAEQLGQLLRAPQPSGHCWDIDAKSVAEVDWDLTPRRRDQSGLFGVLDRLRPKVDVLPLKKCCNVFAGQIITLSYLTDGPAGVVPIPYIRIKDLKRGQATNGSSWLSPDVPVRIDAKWKLRAGDVLLSNLGTIGKVGLVSNGAVGAIAANGLFALRPEQDRLDPHFLLAYLDSFECQSWLGDKTRGDKMRFLPKYAVDELPVPLPPLQLQQTVAKEYREQGSDALTLLARIVTEGERDLISDWIEKITKTLPSSTDSIGDPLDLSPLDSLATEVRPIRNQIAHGRSPQSPLDAWAIQFHEAMTGLRAVQNIPRGPGLLSVLLDAARRLKDATQAIKGHLPNEDKARHLTLLVASWLDMACSALLNDIRLFLRADTEWLHSGDMIEISLQVENQGALPIRDLSISTTPDWGRKELGYLSENAIATIHLAGTGPKVAGPFTIVASWSGLTLDGQQVNGSREIAFDVIEIDLSSKEAPTSIGASPYVCGDPVHPERDDVFFGRDELLDQIRRQIIHSGNVILLEGNRRAGKSSILWHLEGPKAVPGWMGVYCSLQGAEGSREGVGVPTAEVFRETAKCIATSLHTLGIETPLPDGTVLPSNKKLGIAKGCRAGIKEASAFSDFRDYLEVALESLAQSHLGLLLMLDEFDKLQEGIDSGVTSPQVPENIRFLVQTYPRFSAILTGSKRLRRLREEYWSALYGLGTRFGVTSLPEEAARRLVTQPVKGRLTYSREGVERAISLTAGQPYLLQCLCNRIFDLAAQLKTRSITLDLVDRAGYALVEDNEHFASLWDYAKSDRRRFILALCHKEADSSEPFRLGVIQEKLVSHGVEVDDDTLISDLEFLRELELIEKLGESTGDRYVLTIPLMGAWIEKQLDFAALMSRARSETEDQGE